MRKQTKLVAVLSATALLAIGAAMTSFAASGWTDEDGTWVYYDKDGDMVTSEWKKSGDDWYYLDDDGYMATNSYIDSKYYVGEDGRMVKNAWAKFNADDEDDTDPDSEDADWYYFASSGAVTTDSWKKINGHWYSFDSEGKMRYGWLRDDGNYYYLGNEDEGWATTGWAELAPYEQDGDKATEKDSPAGDMDWYWFDSNGKAVKASATASEMKKKTINGYTYYFDQDGIMQDGWKNISIASSATASEVNVYLNDDGVLQTGWVKLDEAFDDDVDVFRPDDSEAWFYLNTKGVPYAYTGEETKRLGTTNGVIKKINGKYYFLDEHGAMVYGLVNLGGDYYYFGAESDGSMKTGKVSGIVENDDEKYTYYFETSGDTKGKGYTGIKDGYIYWNGKLLTAEEDSNYQVVDMGLYEEFDSTNMYLINESGKIQKSAKGKKADNGVKYWTNSDGIVQTGSGENQTPVNDVDKIADPVIEVPNGFEFTDIVMP